MEPLEVFALDRNMNRVTGTIPYTSLTWERRYYEPGEFSMSVLSSVYDPSWAYIYTYDRSEMGMVQKVEYDDTTPGPNGEDIVTVSGFFMEEWLNRLVFLIEQTEMEAYQIPKPTKPVADDPKFVKGADGTIYNVIEWEHDPPSYRNVETGVCTDDPGEVEEFEVPPASSVHEYVVGGTPMGKYKTSYDYYSNDGLLHQVDRHGNEKTYEMVGDVQWDPTAGSSNSQNTALAKDENGNYFWVPGVAYGVEGTYYRQVKSWEEKTEGLQIVNGPGGTYAVGYREVKGPWQLRTDVGDVGKEMDNVQQVILWAQLCFGNNMIYDEPGFTGETKVIDPSLKRVGDLFFDEMKSVGASVRVFYDFVTNSMTFSVWRGLDRTQSANTPEGGVEEEIAAPIAAFSPVVASSRSVPSGYTRVQWIETSGTNYIDTSVAASSETSYRLDAEIVGDVSTESHHILSASGPSVHLIMRVTSGGGGFSARCGASTLTPVTRGSVTGRHVFSFDGGVFKVDNESVSLGASDFDTGKNLPIGGYVNKDGNFTHGTPIRVYAAEFNVSGHPECILTPAIRDSDGAVGMYDSVHDAFISGSGTGGIVAGPSMEPVLPDGYVELEYTENTDKQWVDTGFTPNQNTRVTCDFEVPKKTDNTHRVLFGCRGSNNTRQYTFGWAGHTGGYWRSDFNTKQANMDSTKEVGRHLVDKNKNTTILDGVIKTVDDANFTCPSAMILFGNSENANEPSWHFPARVYSMQIYDNGKIVRNFVPAKRVSDGSVGFYDTEGNKFYGNSASAGALVAGPTVDYPDPATLTYHSNNPAATGSTPPGLGYVGYTVVVDACGFTDPKRTFTGWNTSPDGGGTTYQPGDMFTFADATEDLYAQWEDKPAPPEPTPTGKNPWAVFSDTWGTLYGYTASKDESNYRNKCYVLYDYYEPQWNGDGTAFVNSTRDAEGNTVYTVPQTRHRGFETVRLEDGREDAEVWLDLREEGPEGSDDLPDPSEQLSEKPDLSAVKKQVWDTWRENLKAQGESLLKNDYGVVVNLDTGTLSQDGYMVDWDLGDKVDMAVDRIGLIKEARITSVTEVHEVGSSTVRLEIGEELLTTTKKQGMV